MSLLVTVLTRVSPHNDIIIIMNYVNFLPEKYWNVDDERIDILKKFLDSLKISDLRLLNEDEIIKICIDGIKEFSFSDKDKNKLKDLILEQNAKILIPCINDICDELFNLKEVNIISLGIGNESLFERILDEEISKRLPDLKVNWFGIDVGDFRDPSSFFFGKPFKIINDSVDIKYIEFVEVKTVPTVLVGRYSFHHIGIEYDEFLKRCNELVRCFLVEEPTNTKLWNIPDYRFMRIAYDVLANTVFVVNWAKAFTENPNLFKINYIKIDKLPNNTKSVEFKDMLPETALIVSGF